MCRPTATAEGLAKLRPVFKKDGVVTAGNASVRKPFFKKEIRVKLWRLSNRFDFQGICDGAASVLIASEEAVRENGLTPLARLVAYSTVGVPPEIMGIGPVPAIQNVLKVAGLSLNDIDLFEVYKINVPLIFHFTKNSK